MRSFIATPGSHMQWSLWSYDKPRQHIEKQRHHFANKGLSSQSYGFSSNRVWLWELDLKEGWAPKNWWFWIAMLEKTLEIPLDCKEIKPVHPKGSQPWIFIGRTDAKAETAILWLLDQRADSFEKTQMLGKIEGERWRGWYRMRWLDSITTSMDMNLSKLQEKTGKSGVLQSMESQRVGQDWVNNNVMVLLCPKGIWILIFKPKCT